MTCCNFLQNIINFQHCFIDQRFFHKCDLQQPEIKKKLNSFLHSVVRHKTIGCFEETIGCFEETIGCFEETIGCFEETIGCFSVAVKQFLKF